MNCPLFLFFKVAFLEQEVSGGCSLSSPVILVQELSIAIFPQPLRSMAGNMVVGNSVLLRRLTGCYFHEFPVFVIIGQFSRTVEDGKRPIMIAMEHDPYPDVMATIFVWRDLKFHPLKADAVVGIDNSFFLNAKDVIKIFPTNIGNER